MSVKKSSVLFFMFLISTLVILTPVAVCTGIHILRVKRMSKKDVQTAGLPSLNSKYSKMCLSVQQTFNYLGKDSLKLYKLCDGKFNLLGQSSKLIKEKCPFCYKGLEQFFCKRKIENRDEEGNSTCRNEELINLILSAIKGCLEESEQEVSAKEDAKYRCPSLNFTNFKVENVKDFCLKVQKKEIQNNPDNTKVYSYISVASKLQNDCKYITEMYNSCIDSDNLVFPFSDYKKCLNPKNALFLCNKVENYSKDEEEVCSEFVLPTIAHKSLSMNVYDQEKTFCNDFEKTIVAEYEAMFKSLGEDEKIIQHEIQEIDKKNKNIEEVKTKTNGLLTNIINLNKKWEKFYASMSTTFKIRTNLTETEYSEITHLRGDFDNLFPFAAKLNSLVKDKSFIKVPVPDIYESIVAYYNKADDYIAKLLKTICVFDKLLERNKMLTLTKNKKETKVKFMVTQHFDIQEVKRFGNEYIAIQQYTKNFMNSIMKRANIYTKKLTEEKKDTECKLDKLKKYQEYLNEQKKLFYKKLLTDNNN